MGFRWVDTNKGDNENPEYRSRIVAKDLKTKRDPNMPAIETFAPMPALEMLKLMLKLGLGLADGALSTSNCQTRTTKKVCADLHSRPFMGSWMPPPVGTRRSG